MAEAQSQAIGIDLGTTNSCVGIMRFDRVEIIANEMGNRTTPSMVSFSDNERFIGEAAVSLQISNLKSTIFDAKRLIGKKIDDAFVKTDSKQWPFEVVGGDGGRAMIELSLNGKTKRFFPEEISAMVLSKMKSIAETFIGSEVKNAVITVPAYFNNSQRQSTIDAGKISGLNVLRIINEPTAAAIAYGLHHRISNEKVLLFDLGGGTFDVSVMNIESGIFEVLSTAGDTHLGGEDFDNRLVEHLTKEIKEKYGIDITKSKRHIMKLKKECEKAKIVLSNSQRAHIELDIKSTDISLTVTRSKFENLNDDLFEKCIETVKNAISEAKLDKKEIQQIVLVGGSSRIPKMQSLLREYFEEKEFCKSINPDEAVAYGAAIQASILSGNCNSATNFVLKDVIPLSLGVSIHGGLMSVLMKRNSKIPLESSKEYVTVSDYQKEIRFGIYEGERPMVVDNHYLGEIILGNLKPALKGQCKVQVTFSINSNSILTTKVIEDKTSNKTLVTLTQNIGSMSSLDIERVIEEEKENREKDKMRKLVAETIIDIEEIEYSLKKKIISGTISGRLKIKVENKIDEVKSWIISHPEPRMDELSCLKWELENIDK
mmetsp:Transcript_9373/g.14124  ORF Transcript_9373/g.14124 Transcript_9373/m.14124 type:complete len:600 (+) Transcript_9373:36-1835(+)